MMNSNGNQYKKLVYDYDLISGKVNMMQYQPGYKDMFIHKYSYDAENRLREVETSMDSIIWQKDARYEYYKHGPLARVVLGDQLVQGIDYSYTLQGWLKGINSTALNPDHDMGQDGKSGGPNQYVAKDAFGLDLNYYGGDYASINKTHSPFPDHWAYTPDSSRRPLYNGNISGIAMSLSMFGNPGYFGGATMLYRYRYDQLNRITGMDALNGFNQSANTWSGLTALQQYKERVSYDANGNIQNYKRNGNNSGATIEMDNLEYQYYPGTNQLRRLQESADDENYNYWSFEIEKQNNPNNYKYDSIGNLISDVYEDITNIRWNVYGKIREISHWAYDVVPASKIKYIYDAQGNRIGEVTEQYNGPATNYTWYVRDPQGNIIAVYKASGDTSLTSLNPNVNSYLVYGSSRLGTQYTNIGVNGGPGLRNLLDSFTFTRGYRIYELTNHLGNVVTTITDRKWGTPVGASGSAISYYNADVNTATDYFPFGMPMVGRVHMSYGQFYRFGFNGKMNDDDVKGYFKQQDYGMRIYDPRVGRFLSVDPLTSIYPMLTPYQFASNRPIAGIDQDGLEFYSSNSSRIAIGLQFDSKLKKITSFSTYYRRLELPDRLNAFIDYYNTCSNCIGSSASEVASFTLNIKSPFIKTAAEANATDIDLEEGSAMGPSSSGSKIPIIPKNKKEASEQQSSRRFFTEGASGRIGKANALLAGIDLTSKLIEKLGNDNLAAIIKTAQNQSLDGAVKTIGIIQKAIDAGQLNGHLDQGSLVGLSNYLLYGAKIEKYQVLNGKGSYVEDLELTKIAKRLWSGYMTPISQQRRNQEQDRSQRQKIDNTGVNK